jgi:hypothetical protein
MLIHEPARIPAYDLIRNPLQSSVRRLQRGLRRSPIHELIRALVPGLIRRLLNELKQTLIHEPLQIPVHEPALELAQERGEPYRGLPSFASVVERPGVSPGKERIIHGRLRISADGQSGVQNPETRVAGRRVNACGARGWVSLMTKDGGSWTRDTSQRDASALLLMTHIPYVVVWPFPTTILPRGERPPGRLPRSLRPSNAGSIEACNDR